MLAYPSLPGLARARARATGAATLRSGAWLGTISAMGVPERLQTGVSSWSRSSGICEPGTAGATLIIPMMADAGMVPTGAARAASWAGRKPSAPLRVSAMMIGPPRRAMASAAMRTNRSPWKAAGETYTGSRQ